MIVVSACLLGVNCKYNGKNNDNEKVKGVYFLNFFVRRVRKSI